MGNNVIGNSYSDVINRLAIRQIHNITRELTRKHVTEDAWSDAIDVFRLNFPMAIVTTIR